MEDALKETCFADTMHPDLRKVAEELRAGDGDPVRIAERTFSFVRDDIRFGFDLYRRKASDVLKRGHGVCWGKALLLTTLLRCNRIPARFGSIPVKNSFVAPAIGTWSVLANNPFNHCLTIAWLNDRWTMLDAALDRRTYEAFFAPAGVKWGIDWNGWDDVRLYTESIVGAVEAHLDLDAALHGRVGNTELPGPLALLGYRHVNGRMWKRAGICTIGVARASAPYRGTSA